VEHLVFKLSDLNLPDKDKIAVLEALKLCARENVALEPLEQRKFIELVFSLNEAKTSNVSDAALKLLVNIITNIKSAMPIFIDKNGPEKVVTKLKNSSISSPELFPLCKILFQLSLKSSLILTLNDLNTIDYVSSLLEEGLHKTPLQSGTLAELLKVIFNLTMNFGPLSSSGNPEKPTEQQVKQFQKLIPLYAKILDFPSENPELYQLKISVLNNIINLSNDANFQSLRSIINDKVLTQLVEILRIQVNTDNTVEGLIAILMVLTMIARQVKESRAFLRNAIFPPNFENELTMEGPKEKDSISSKLREHLMSSNIAIKYYTQELLFILVGEDGEQFARLCGLGPSAGLFTDKNLLGLFGALTAKVNPPQCQKKAQENDTSDEEAEEREAAELMEKMQRLQSSGVVKFVKDQEN